MVRAEDCSALRMHHIIQVEVFEAVKPFRMVRLNPDGSFLLSCFAGKGRILLDGNWRDCGAGRASVWRHPTR